MDTPVLPCVANEVAKLLFEFEARNGFKTDILKYIKIGFAGGVFQPLLLGPRARGCSLAWKRMRRFVRESLRLAHRGAPCHPVPTVPDRDVVRPFGRNGGKPPPRKSEAIFVEPMGSTYTHQERFTHGVDEHPHFGP